MPEISFKSFLLDRKLGEEVVMRFHKAWVRFIDQASTNKLVKSVIPETTQDMKVCNRQYQPGLARQCMR
jgi:hypothetical protein